MDHKIEKLIRKPVLEGQVGESHVWDGPLNQEGRAHGMGSSSGITGMEVLKAPTMYKAGPITRIAKGK